MPDFHRLSRFFKLSEMFQISNNSNGNLIGRETGKRALQMTSGSSIVHDEKTELNQMSLFTILRHLCNPFCDS